MTVTDQPAPVANEHTPIPVLVCADLAGRPHLGAHRLTVTARVADRAEHGRATYGIYLQPHNGRDPLADLDDEIIDAAQYAKQAIVELAERAPADRDLPALNALYEDLLHMACAVASLRANRQAAGRA